MNPLMSFIQSHLPPLGDLSEFEKALEFKVYESGSKTSAWGEVCTAFRFLVSGKMYAYYLNAEGKAHTWGLYFNDSDSQFLNLFPFDNRSFVTQSPSILNYEVIEKAEIIELPYAKTQELYQLGGAYAQLGRLMNEGAFAAFHQRSFSLLTQNAKDRYLEIVEHQSYLLDKFQHYYIASYLGITSQSLSRIRKVLENE